MVSQLLMLCFRSCSALLGNPRFPTIIVAPITSQVSGKWVSSPELYPVLSVGTASLNRESVVLLDSLRAIDATRVKRRIGHLSSQEYDPVEQGLRIIYRLKRS
jgi:mRNA interferase MazF